jgi:hypothetical protein
MKSQLLILFLLAACSTILAQDRQLEMPTKPANCESDIAVLDSASIEAGENGLIIAIARLGDGDRRRDLNHRRLHNVRTYLTQWGGKRHPKNVITAVGDRIKDYGRVELYVAGKLHWVILIRPNADLIVGSCTYEINSPDEQRRENNLYPWRDRFQRKLPRKRLSMRTPNKSLDASGASVFRIMTGAAMLD